MGIDLVAVAPVSRTRIGTRHRLGGFSRALLLGWLLQVALRVWAFWYDRAPAAWPDEAGYLYAARVLAGGPGGDLSHSTFYQGGYPLLLSPVYWFTSDPETVYRLVVGINTLVGAAVFPLAVLMLRRLGVGGPVAFLLAFAAALLPANVYFGGWALTDAILPAVVAAWLLALVVFADAGSRKAGVTASLLAGYAFAVHSRGDVILAVHVAVLCFLLARAWVPRRHTLLAAGVAVVCYAAARGLNAEVLRADYPYGSSDMGTAVWSRLTSPEGLARTLSGACGQLWYLTVATYGLAGLGLVGAVAVLATGRHGRSLRLVSAVVLATTLGIALATCAALTDEHRVGNYVYGRYLALIAVPLALGGIAVAIGAGRRVLAGAALATAALVAGTSLAVVAYAGSRLHTDNFIAFDFPETSFLTRNWTSFDMLGAGLAAGALFLCMLAFRRWPEWVGALLLAVNMAFLAHLAQPAFGRPATHARPALTGRGGVEVAAGVDWRVAVDLRFRAGWTEVRTLSPSGPRPGTCMVLTPWNAAPIPGWHVADRQPGAWVWWQRPGCH
jgi:hypothetical protein